MSAAGQRADVLIVLGAMLAADGTPAPALAERVEAGVRAFLDGAAPWLLMTGACEAKVMRDRAVALGVDARAILLEPTARTTRENALRSGELMRQHGLRRALIVTQPYHRRRAVACFRRVGVEAEALAFESRRPLRPRQLARECVALAAYAARGWLALY